MLFEALVLQLASYMLVHTVGIDEEKAGKDIREHV